MITSTIQLKVQTGGASQKLRGLNQQLGQMQGQARKASAGLGGLAGAASKLAGALAGLAAAGAAIKFLGDSLKIASDRQVDMALLAKQLQAVGRGADEIEKLRKAADKFGKATLFNEEDLIKSFKVLSSFRAVAVEDFEEIGYAIADVAQIMEVDMKSATLQVAKALEDPARGMTALSRSGTTFSTEQQKVIKALQESGDLMGAQRVILDTLKSQYSEAALTAGRQGFAGAMDTLGEETRDLQEAIGRDLMPAVTALVGVMTSAIKALKDMPAPIRNLLLGVTALTAAVAALAAAWTVVGPAAKAALAGMKALWALALANPWVAVAAGVAALVVQLVSLKSETQRIMEVAAGGGAVTAGGVSANIEKSQAQYERNERRIAELRASRVSPRSGAGSSQRRELARLLKEQQAIKQGQAQGRQKLASMQQAAGVAAAPVSIGSAIPGGAGSGSSAKSDAEALAREQERLAEAAAQRLKTSIELVTAARDEYRLLTARSPLERAAVQDAIDREQIQSKYNALLAEATQEGTVQNLNAAKAAELESVRFREQQRAFNLQKEISAFSGGRMSDLQQRLGAGAIEMQALKDGSNAQMLLELNRVDLEYAERRLAIQEQMSGARGNDLAVLERELALLPAKVQAEKEVVKAIYEQAEATAQLRKQQEDNRRIFDSIGDSIKTGLVDGVNAAIRGTESLRQVMSRTLDNISQKLLDIGLNFLLFGSPFGQASGGGGLFGGLGGLFGGLFGGFRASGGPVSRGKAYVVGENGPELFTPSSSGTISPNRDMGGDGGSTNISVNVDASGTKAEGDDRKSGELGRLIGAAIQAELIKQKRPGGILYA